MESYEGFLTEEYWSNWTKRTYQQLTPAPSWVCPNKLWDVAKRLGYKDTEGRLHRAMGRLTKGANICCEGDGRLPTSRANSKAAAEYGVRVADSLQG